MGNFLRRFLSFLLGMVFGFVALAGAIVGVGYTVYKNASLNDLGVTEETLNLGELNDATIEELVALFSLASKNPTSFTFEELEKTYGLDVNGMLTSMGIDANSVHPDDIKAFKQISPFALNEEGFNNISFGAVLAFIPATDGVYPVFSDGARAKLRSYTLGEIMATNENGESYITTLLYSLPLGSILSSVYTETYNSNTATYSYSTADGGFLDTLGHLSLNAFNDMGGDFGYALNEGALTELGSTTFGDLFGFESDGNSLTSAFTNATFGDLFVKNGEVYEFNFMAILNDIEVGALMGMNKCDVNCTLEHTHQAGWYDAYGNLVTADDIAGEIMINLYNVTIEDLTNGTFDVTNIMGGIYFGKAFGLSITNKDGYCLVDCTEDHTHEYYWVFSDGEYAGAMNNALGNISISQVLEGELDLQEALGEVRLGEFMNMRYCNGSQCSINHTHQAGWYDGDDNLINGNNISDDIMLALYDVTIDELMSGEFDIASVSDGIYFGSALGYTIDTDAHAGYCVDGCVTDHAHKFYWVDAEDKFAGDINNAIANISLADAMNGNVNIDSALDDVKLGSLMGNEYKNGAWYDSNGDLIVYENLESGDKILYNMYGETVNDLTNGGFDLNSILGDMYVGEIMSYKGSVGSWQKPNGSGGYENASAMESLMADILMSDLLDGKVDFQSKVNALKLGDVIEVQNSSILSLLADTQISNLPTAIDELYVGEVMGYKLCTNNSSCPMGSSHSHDGKWYDSTNNLVTGVHSALCKYTIKQLSNGEFEIGNDLTVGEFIETDGSPILKLLENETLASAPDATNNLLLGEVMGYERQNKTGYCETTCTLNHSHEFYWVKGGAQISGINSKLANYTIKDVSDGKLDGLTDTLTMGDVFNESQLSTGAFSLMYIGEVGGKSYSSVGEIPLGEISNRTLKGVETATYAQLENAGISLLDSDVEDKITIFYAMIYNTNNGIPAGKTWQEAKTLPQVISDIVNNSLGV